MYCSGYTRRFSAKKIFLAKKKIFFFGPKKKKNFFLGPTVGPQSPTDGPLSPSVGLRGSDCRTQGVSPLFTHSKHDRPHRAWYSLSSLQRCRGSVAALFCSIQSKPGTVSQLVPFFTSRTCGLPFYGGHLPVCHTGFTDSTPPPILFCPFRVVHFFHFIFLCLPSA